MFLFKAIVDDNVTSTSCSDRKLKKEVDLIQTGHLDSRLEELWTDVSQ